jgi:hypothetical protein
MQNKRYVWLRTSSFCHNKHTQIIDTSDDGGDDVFNPQEERVKCDEAHKTILFSFLVRVLPSVLGTIGRNIQRPGTIGNNRKCMYDVA